MFDDIDFKIPLSMTANQFKLLDCPPPILDIVFRAHSGNSPSLPLSSNSIIWIRVGDYLHPLPKCQHGMQLNIFLLQIILQVTDHIFFAGLLTQPSTQSRWRSGPSPHCSPPSRLACWQGNISSSEMEKLPTLGLKYWDSELGLSATLRWKYQQP